MKNNTRKQSNITPLVSVVMPVFNAQKYLKDSIESILNQTYKNFEFIIIGDGSTDNSLEIVSKYAKKNKKIKFIKNHKNLGVSAAVKRAIEIAKGEYLARMDADDISLPERLTKQVNYLQKNKKTVALGTQCYLIDKKGNITGKKIFPTKFEEIYKYIYRFVPVQQPSLMIARKRLPKNFEYYTDGMNTAEEIELIFKLFYYGKVENLPDVLLKYRLHGKNTSLENLKKTFMLTLLSRIKAIYKYNYKPDFAGIMITLAQVMLVLVLPRSMVLLIYKLTRKTANFNYSLPIFTRHFAPALDDPLY